MTETDEPQEMAVFALTEVERLRLENLALKRQILEQQMLTLKLEQQNIEAVLRQRLQVTGAMSVDVTAGYVRVVAESSSHA